MNSDDLILVSVDDHLVEPPSMFDEHTPAKWKGRFPSIERNDKGDDVWMFEDRSSPTSASTLWPDGQKRNTELNQPHSMKSVLGVGMLVNEYRI